MKKILITGAKGFLGSNLSNHFNNLGYETFGVGHRSPSSKKEKELSMKYWIDGDITKKSILELDNKYDVIINSVRWGNTPMNALEDGNEHHEAIKTRILKSPQLPKQPDLHLHIVVPNEFTPVAKKNIGVTAGIETTIPVPQWIEGMNRMD